MLRTPEPVVMILADNLLQPSDAGTRLTILIGRMNLAPGMPIEKASGMVESLWVHPSGNSAPSWRLR